MGTSYISLANALGWALIHSLWQAGIIFLIVHLLLKLFRRAPARARYLLAMGALAGIFICFLVTFYGQWAGQQSVYTAQASVAGFPAPVSPETYISGAAPAHLIHDWFQPGLLVPCFVVLYFLGLFFCLGKVVRDIFMMRRIRHTRVSPFDDAWKHYLDRLSQVWNIPRKVGLFVSGCIDVPVVIGYLKPVIYLPFSVANNLPPDQIEAILLHELAHIRRNDFLLNILQTLVDTILFFNPFVYWISKTIRVERENCCDELVTSVVRPKQYAHALLSLSEGLLLAEERRMKQGRFVLAAVAEKQQLFQRIKRIMEMKTKKLNYFQKLLALFILAGSIASISWLAPGEKIHQSPEQVQGDTSAVLMPVARQDSILPQAPLAPPAPPVPSKNSLAAPPVPPAPSVLPPSPPDTIPLSGQRSSRSMDTAGFLSFPPWHYQAFSDTAMHDMQQKLQRYAQKIQQYAQHMQQQFNSDEWKKYQQDIQAYSQKLRDYFNSSEWKKQQEKIKEEAAKMRQQFNSSAWRQHLDSSIRQQNIALLLANAARRQHLDSSIRQQAMIRRDSLLTRLTSAKERFAWARPDHHATMVLSNGGHTVRPDQIARMLMEDGLLKNAQDYTIRLNDGGLYVNGKKQAQQYFEKYHRMVGDHTSLKIKKKNGHTQASINTSETKQSKSVSL